MEGRKKTFWCCWLVCCWCSGAVGADRSLCPLRKGRRLRVSCYATDAALSDAAGQTLTLEYEAGSWTLAEIPPIVDASACNAMLTALMGLEPASEAGARFGQGHGLAEPLVRLRVITTRGRPLAFAFGDQNPSPNSRSLLLPSGRAGGTLRARRAAPLQKQRSSLNPFAGRDTRRSRCHCALSDGEKIPAAKTPDARPGGRLCRRMAVGRTAEH